MQIITIFGGSGFIGSNLIPELAKINNYSINVVTRNKNKLKKFKVIPNVKLIQIDNFDRKTLSNVIKHSTIVINLIGILHENKRNSFEKVHTQFPKLIQEISLQLKIQKFIHLSALKSESSASKYLKSKFDGEKELIKNINKINTYILKPSIIFGKYDNFINLFLNIIKISPFMSIISPNSLFQPVSVVDLNKIIIQLVRKNIFKSRTFEIAGDEVFSFYEIVKLIKSVKKIKCFLFKLPSFLEIPLVTFMQILPVKIITKDNLKSLKEPNICEINHAYEFLPDLKKLKTYLKQL